jgi:hypothetical protein
MSSITKILTDKDSSSEEKLSAVADVVSVARKAYGNEDAEVAVPSVQTTNGSMPFIHLEDDSKVEILRHQLASLKARAVEASEQDSAVNINKEIEKLLATNGYFVNIAGGVKFEYI